jgi:glycosyltransferase involved in cell wall biosynthesis
MPKISVVIPSYNHAAYIGAAVKSVLTQTETDLELIIVDDGSTDGTMDILSGYSDPRIKIFPQTNQGAHAAINRGLRETSAEYLSILNSDDYYEPKRLEKTISVLQSDGGVGLVGSHIRIINQYGKQIGIKHGYKDSEPWLLEAPDKSFRAGLDLTDALLTENYWSTTSNYVFTRSHFENAGDFLPLRFVHDWDFALRLARLGKMVMLPEPLVCYRVHERNTIREDRAALIFEICWILAVHIPVFMSDPAFFNHTPLQKRIDQLLHSIYVYECDRVLTVLLLQNLYKDSEQALKLLEPDDLSRKMYLEFIIGKLDNNAK